jgi:hypothetical protein
LEREAFSLQSAYFLSRLPDNSYQRSEEGCMSLSENNLLAKVGLDATILLAAATGLLYVVGTYYRIGYLEQWGIEPSLFTSDIYENLVAGFTVLNVGITYLLIILAVIGAAALGYSGMAIEIWRKESIQKKVNWLKAKIADWEAKKPEVEPPKFLTNLEAFIAKSWRTCLILLAVAYPFYKAMNCPSELGKEYAVKEYEQYSQSNAQGDQKSLFSKLRTYCIDGAQRNALLLATDRSTYALYFPKTKTAAESVEIIAAARITCIKATKNTAP